MTTQEKNVYIGLLKNQIDACIATAEEIRDNLVEKVPAAAAIIESEVNEAITSLEALSHNNEYLESVVKSIIKK